MNVCLFEYITIVNKYSTTYYNPALNDTTNITNNILQSSQSSTETLFNPSHAIPSPPATAIPKEKKERKKGFA